MKVFSVVLAGALVGASGAQALDCIVPTAENIVVAHTPEQLILLGRFTFAEPIWPGVDTAHDDPIPVAFEGLVLGPDGFEPIDLSRVQFHFVCQDWGCGPWGVQDMVVVADDSRRGDPMITVDACFSTVAPAPLGSELLALKACAADGTCEALTWE